MALTCPECNFELKPGFFESPEYQACNICGVEVALRAFPAAYQPPQLISAADLNRSEDDASCFYHDSKRAAQTCSQCGRFICALCAAEFGGNIFCPGCVVSGEKRSTLPQLERERTLYDSLALMLATWPMLTISLSIIGAPAAIYIAARYWKRPTSIVRRSGYRKYLAIVLALLQLGFWGLAIFGLIVQSRNRAVSR
jgi:uncharacterized paraquat-inducible protein A